MCVFFARSRQRRRRVWKTSPHLSFGALKKVYGLTCFLPLLLLLPILQQQIQHTLGSSVRFETAKQTFIGNFAEPCLSRHDDVVVCWLQWSAQFPRLLCFYSVPSKLFCLPVEFCQSAAGWESKSWTGPLLGRAQAAQKSSHLKSYLSDL